MKLSTGIVADFNNQPVTGYRSTAGHSASVTAALPDYWGGLACDGALVHTGRAIYDISVGRDLSPAAT